MMRRALGFVDRWQFWVVLAYFGLAAVSVSLYALNRQHSRVEQRQASEDTLRIAERHASAQGAYRLCIASIATLEGVNRFVRGVQELEDTLYRNALEVHQEAPPGSVLAAIQAANLARLARSADDVRAIHLQVPTKASCELRRTEILEGVQP